MAVGGPYDAPVMCRTLLLAIWLLVGCSPRVADTPPAAATIRVATWNIHYQPRPADEVAAAVRALDADVLCLQETNPQWEAVLRGSLSSDYPVMLFHPDGGTAMLSRLALREVIFLHSPLGYNNATSAKVDTPGGPLVIVNVHLRPAFDESGRPTLGSFLRGAGEEHIVELTEYVQHIERDAAVVVLGDFNEENDKGLRWLAERGYEDVLRRDHGGAATFSTRYGPRGVLGVHLQLDHVLIRGPVRATGVWIGDAAGSDHRPVVAELEASRSRD